MFELYIINITHIYNHIWSSTIKCVLHNSHSTPATKKQAQKGLKKISVSDYWQLLPLWNSHMFMILFKVASCQSRFSVIQVKLCRSRVSASELLSCYVEQERRPVAMTSRKGFIILTKRGIPHRLVKKLQTFSGSPQATAFLRRYGFECNGGRTVTYPCEPLHKLGRRLSMWKYIRKTQIKKRQSEREQVVKLCCSDQHSRAGCTAHCGYVWLTSPSCFFLSSAKDRSVLTTTHSSKQILESRIMLSLRWDRIISVTDYFNIKNIWTGDRFFLGILLVHSFYR